MMAVMVAASLFGQPCNKLFFSEYIEGSGNNKALEIYNPTSAPVSLFGYKVVLYNNGSTSAGSTLNFNASAIIAPGDVFVIANSQADSVSIKPKADTLSGVTNFNGDDAVQLMYGTTVIDVFGILGNDPGTAWNVGRDTNGTVNHTLIRKSSVQQGVTAWDTTQWLVFPLDTFRLGLHTGPTGLTPCVTTPQDTIANFSPTSGTLTAITGNYSLPVQLSLPHTDSMHVDIALTSNNAAFLNNYTTQTLGFPSGAVQRSLTVNVTNTDSSAHTFVFKLINPSTGLVIGPDSIFTLNLTAPAAAGVDSCATLFFSEYVEGSASNKALEIYNPTNAAVVLDGYKIQAYSNGGVTPSGTFNLTGNLAAGDVYVVVYSAADTLKPYADTVTTNNAVNFNGDDAIVLLRGIDTLDIVGVIGQNQIWPVGSGSTQNRTLVRNSNVKKGNTNWSVAVAQWSVLPTDSVQLGAHTGPTSETACALSPLPTGLNEAVSNISRIYPNPNNGNFTIELNSIENSAEVTLFDLAGRMVYYTKENSSKLNVSTGNLTTGMYIVEVKTGNLSSRIKVTIQ